MKAKIAVVGLGVLASLAVIAAPKLSPEEQARQEKIKELLKVADETRTTFGVWNPGYLKYYVEGESDEAAAARREKYLAALRELMSLDPSNADYRLDYAEALLYREDAEGAEPEYRKAKELFLALPERALAAKRNALAKAMYGIANCRFADGDREGALAELKAIAALPSYGVRRGEHHWAGSAGTARAYLEGNLLDGLHLPRHTGAKVYPDAHQAEYSETFTPLKKVTVKGLDADDLRYELLKCKLAARGVEVERAGLLSLFSGAPDFLLEVVGDAPEAELAGARKLNEAYRLEVGAKGAKVTACTKLGVTWGVVSFIQLLDEKKPAVRQAKILDWSDLKERGCMSMFWPHEIEFALFFRINSIDAQQHPTYDDNFRPLDRFAEEEQGRLASGFGLKYYFGIAWATMYPHLPLSAERTLRWHEKICKFHAKSSAGVYFPFDDGRYAEKSTKSGMVPADDKAYGSAANIDGLYMTKLFREVKAEYPGFFLVFCPPFYWGPDSAAAYPEDRDTYLKKLGETLDPEVDVYWTGPMVKSYNIRKYQVDWFANLTKHKPLYSQNGLGQHNLVNYIVDDIPFGTWFYDTIDDDLAGFNVNGRNNQLDMQCLPAAYFWNRKAYDKDATMKRAVQQLFGERMYDILKPGRDALAYFDKYKYGILNAGIIYEKPDDLKAKWILASNCWAEAQAYCPLVSGFGYYGAAVGFAEKVYKGSLNPPDFMKKHKADIEATEALAAKEAGFDRQKGDLFFSPIALAGPKYVMYGHPKKVKNEATGRYDYAPGGGTLPKRFISTLRGAQSATPSARFNFECDPFPPAGDYTLVICALGDETAEQNRLCVKVNGAVIADDLDLGFDNLDYRVKTLTIPFKSMKRNNTVEISQLNQGTNMNGTPWLAINYVIVSPHGKKK